MTKDELIELAQIGMGIHSPNAPEYIVCAALIEALAQPQPYLYVKDIGGNFHLLKEKGHTENCMPLADDVRNHLPPSHSELVEKIVAQPEQEPVAWLTKTGSVWKTKADETDTPLYTKEQL